MTRMSAAEKEKSHERILREAARLFRERGVESTSVADVMKAAGLTHGGFYKHFPSKQALVAAAFRRASDELLAEVERAPDEAARARARARYIARYLSPEHAMNAGHGCPLAALGSEIARSDGPVKKQAMETLERVAAALAPDDDQASNGKGLAMMALLLGTVTLARLAGTPEPGQKILDAGRKGADALEKCWRG